MSGSLLSLPAQDLLVVPAKVLLLGTFAVTLIRSIKLDLGFAAPFERLILAFLAICFFQPVFSWLLEMSDSLTAFFSRIGNSNQFTEYLQARFKELAKDSTPYGGPVDYGSEPGHQGSPVTTLNLLTLGVQGGVYGILAGIAHIGFFLGKSVLGLARDVLFQIALIFFPLVVAFTPISPKFLLGGFLIAVELSLWIPVLKIIEIATGAVATKFLNLGADDMLGIIALEIISILLTLSVPSIVHRVVSGGIGGGDFFGRWSQVLYPTFPGKAQIVSAMVSGASKLRGGVK